MDSNTSKRMKSYILLGKSSTNTDVSVYSSKYSLVIKQREILIPKYIEWFEELILLFHLYFVSYHLSGYYRMDTPKRSV